MDLEESQALLTRLLKWLPLDTIKKRDEADAIEKKTFKRLVAEQLWIEKINGATYYSWRIFRLQSRRKPETPMSLFVDVLELEKRIL